MSSDDFWACIVCFFIAAAAIVIIPAWFELRRLWRTEEKEMFDDE